MTAAAAQISFPITPQVEEQRAPSTQNQIWAAMDSGVFAALRGAPNGPGAQVVYTLLARRLPNIEPSLRRIGVDVGLTRRSAARALETLVACGIVRRQRQRDPAGDFNATRYELADLRQSDVVRDCLAKIRGLKKGGSDAHVTTSKAGGSDAHVTTGSDAHVTRVVTPTSPKVVSKDTKKQQGVKHPNRTPQPAKSRASAAASDDGRRDEVIEALTEAEIGEPTKARLRKIPGITAEIVRREVEAGQAAGKRTGAIVLNIIAAIGATAKRREKVKRRAERLQEADEARARKRERDKARTATGAERRKHIETGKDRIAGARKAG